MYKIGFFKLSDLEKMENYEILNFLFAKYLIF